MSWVDKVGNEEALKRMKEQRGTEHYQREETRKLWTFYFEKYAIIWVVLQQNFKENAA